LFSTIDGPVDVASTINRLNRASDAQLAAIKVTGKLRHNPVDGNLFRAALNVEDTKDAVVTLFDEELGIMVEGDSANYDAFGDALFDAWCRNRAGRRRHQAVGSALKITGTRTGDLKRYALAVGEFRAFDDGLNQRDELGEAAGGEAVLHHGALGDELRRVREVHRVAAAALSIVWAQGFNTVS
jgi:hypothetical protein